MKISFVFCLLIFSINGFSQSIETADNSITIGSDSIRPKLNWTCKRHPKGILGYYIQDTILVFYLTKEVKFKSYEEDPQYREFYKMAYAKINHQEYKSPISNSPKWKNPYISLNLKWDSKFDTITNQYKYYVNDTLFVFKSKEYYSFGEYVSYSEYSSLERFYEIALGKISTANYNDSLQRTPFFKREQLLKKGLDKERKGTGNNTFTFSLNNFENVVNFYTVKQFENSLTKWESGSLSNHVNYKFNEKTKKHDLPFYSLGYSSSTKEFGYFSITVESNVSKTRISKIILYAILPGMKLARLQKSLVDNGYLVNSNLTYIFGKQTWVNEKRKIMILFSNSQIEIVKTS